jgi:hypothetical protein
VLPFHVLSRTLHAQLLGKVTTSLELQDALEAMDAAARWGAVMVTQGENAWVQQAYNVLSSSCSRYEDTVYMNQVQQRFASEVNNSVQYASVTLAQLSDTLSCIADYPHSDIAMAMIVGELAALATLAALAPAYVTAGAVIHALKKWAYAAVTTIEPPNCNERDTVSSASAFELELMTNLEALSWRPGLRRLVKACADKLAMITREFEKVSSQQLQCFVQICSEVGAHIATQRVLADALWQLLNAIDSLLLKRGAFLLSRVTYYLAVSAGSKRAVTILPELYDALLKGWRVVLPRGWTNSRRVVLSRELMYGY